MDVCATMTRSGVVINECHQLEHDLQGVDIAGTVSAKGVTETSKLNGMGYNLEDYGDWGHLVLHKRMIEMT